jgi:hypothetical protein
MTVKITTLVVKRIMTFYILAGHSSFMAAATVRNYNGSSENEVCKVKYFMPLRGWGAGGG